MAHQTLTKNRLVLSRNTVLDTYRYYIHSHTISIFGRKNDKIKYNNNLPLINVENIKDNIL